MDKIKKISPKILLRILGLQSRTAIYNGNYKSILGIVVSGICLTLLAEIRFFQPEETVTSATVEPFAVSYWPELTSRSQPELGFDNA
ncbi:hypothetical protein B0192_06615 [Leptospira interrogans serovar Australis]|nr:hypothetical protein B0191_10690 [Leptospira interrogans serovar Hardjo]OOB99254.1 hypothetical protein B0192_06615 [Leptospira interrogans serovar Australis]